MLCSFVIRLLRRMLHWWFKFARSIFEKLSFMTCMYNMYIKWKQKIYRIEFWYKIRILSQFFWKKQNLQNFCLNFKKNFFETQNFQKISHNPPKSYHAMILNTKNGIYNEVWHSCPYSTRNDKPSKTMLRISSPPPGLIRVK